MEIIRATHEHVDQIAILFDQYRVWYGKESDVKAAQIFLSERLKNDESILFAARINGKIEGFTQLYPLFSSTRMKRIWLLNDLFVTENCRGKSLGRNLIHAAKQWARETEAAEVALETQKTNTPANGLYLDEGFKLSTEVNYYQWTTT